MRNFWLNPKKPTVWNFKKRHTDTVPKNAHEGDLLLIYFGQVKQKGGGITFVYLITKECGKGKKAEHSGKPDWWATTQRICKLKNPLSFEIMKNDKKLKQAKAGFILNKCQTRQNVTQYWKRLYDLIVDSNPQAKNILKEYAPQRPFSKSHNGHFFLPVI